MKKIEIKLSKDELKKKLDILPQLTAKEIRNKLEILEDNERLDISAIKGIEDLEDKIKKLENKKGGNTYVQGGGKIGVQTIVAGSNITVDSTDPQNPIVSSTATTTSEISIVTGMDGGGASSTYGGTLGRPIIYGGHASTYFPSENTIIGGGLATTTGIPFSGGLA